MALRSKFSLFFVIYGAKDLLILKKSIKFAPKF